MKVLEIIPSGDACGAEVRGVDLGEGLKDVVFDEIDAAFNKHSVIVLRNQSITPEQHIDLSDRLGGIVPHTLSLIHI